MIQPDAPSYDFTPLDLEELRELLGDRLPEALSGLQLAAAIYIGARSFRSQRRSTRTELQRLGATFVRTERAVAALSPVSREVLAALYDWRALRSGAPLVSGFEAVILAADACTDARNRLADLQTRSLNAAATLLAHAVAGALAGAQLPISKGRSGLFAKVLSVIWYAVDRKAPTEVAPYVRIAASVARRNNPELAAPKGRPRRRK